MALYVGTLTNRDPEQMADLKAFIQGYMEINTLDFHPGPEFNERHFRDQAEKHQVKFVLAKWVNAEFNEKFVKKLRKTKINFVNRLEAIQTCQSRRKTFQLLHKRMPKVSIPKTFKKWKEIKKAFAEGKAILVRRDAHHIPKEERTLGIAHDLRELYNLVRYNQPRDLFFQEYLGEKEETFKAYIIDQSVICLKKIGRQDAVIDESKLESMRVEISPDVKNLLLEIGKKFGMQIYGLDYFYYEGKLVIIDINDFPSFRGIEEAPKLIGDFIGRLYKSIS